MTVTPEQVSAAADQGIYWWVTPADTVYGTAEQTPADPDDVYLLRASESWLAQWEGDWAKAAEQINAAIQANDAKG